MKKTLIAFAVLGTLASVASAQTAVTIYGIVDAGIVAERGGPAGSVTKLTSGIQQGSRLGFKGVEDLGGGLSAKFVLESGFNIDNGTMGQGGLLFGRQAYVGLGGQWGDVNLGRQYSPHFELLDQIDPFHTGLAGTATNLIPTVTRMNNTIKFASAPMGGVVGSLAYGFGEVAGDNKANRQLGAAIGYDNGPLAVKVAHHRAENALATDRSKNTLLGARYDFGVAAASLGFQVDKGLSPIDARDYLVGVSAPVGAGTILASYIRRNDRSALNQDAHQWALGYSHQLSKRTNFYTSFAKITNDNGAPFTVGSAIETGSGDKAFNVGIRHKF